VKPSKDHRIELEIENYAGNSPGDVAIYNCKPPYSELVVDDKNRAAALAMLKAVEYQG
jgi:hypothetical protein